MAKRQLTEDEKKICNNQVVRLKHSIGYTEYIIEHSRLMIDRGLKANYDKQLAEYKDKSEEFENELTLTKEKIRILTDQLRNGVTIKEEKKEEQ